MENLIKWTKKDYSELRKTVNQFNRRVRELESYGREVVPEEVTYRDIKSNIYSRREFNRVIKELRRFQNRHEADVVTLDSGETLTRWELKNIKRGIQRATNRLSKELIEEENSLEPSSKRIQEIKSTIKSFESLEDKKLKDLKRLSIRAKALGVTDYELKKAKTFQENFIKAYKGMHRKEIVKWAKGFNNPLEFYDAVKNSNLVDLQERYDVEAGLIILSMSKDDSYYFELDKLGISY